MILRPALVVASLVLALAVSSTPLMGAEVKVGDSVLAYWTQAGAYFVGTAVEKKNVGFVVVFEDGDMATVASAKVRANNIKAGSKVMARWKDGKYYPGKVAKVVGRALYINFDDGSKAWSAWSGIAVEK